jgi:hypothetical protein
MRCRTAGQGPCRVALRGDNARDDVTSRHDCARRGPAQSLRAVGHDHFWTWEIAHQPCTRRLYVWFQCPTQMRLVRPWKKYDLLAGFRGIARSFCGRGPLRGSAYAREESRRLTRTRAYATRIGSIDSPARGGNTAMPHGGVAQRSRERGVDRDLVLDFRDPGCGIGRVVSASCPVSGPRTCTAPTQAAAVLPLIFHLDLAPSASTSRAAPERFFDLAT